MEILEIDISLEDLAFKEWLSVRSENVCRSQNLFSLNKILEFYNENGSFLSIKNCGAKSEKELVEICKKYTTTVSQKVEQKQAKSTIVDFRPFQSATLYRFVEYLLSQLSIRAYNGLKAVSKIEDIGNVIAVLTESNVNFNSIHNIGEKTVKELNSLRLQIKEFIENLPLLSNNQLTARYTRIILEAQNLHLTGQYEELFDGNYKLKLFYLIKLLVQSTRIFSENEKSVFNNTYCQSENISFEQLAGQLSLTKERVRQITRKIEDDLNLYFSFIDSFNIDDFVTYQISSEQNFIVIDKSFGKKINEFEDVNYNAHLYCKLFENLLKNTHGVLSINNIIANKKTINKRKYSNYYLVANILLDAFKYEKLISDIYGILNDKISPSYSVHFEGFLAMYLCPEKKKYFKEIVESCGIILFNEFDLIVDVEGYLYFETNTRKPIYQYCYEVLKTHSSPMTVDEIDQSLRKNYPDVKFYSDSLRNTMIREKELFICFGRTSTYALREWENERENFKGGTIRDIVFDYLNQSDTPIHISDIWKHVELFRGSTYARSIHDNLKADESNRFSFIEGGFICLKNKDYDLDNLSYKKMVGSQFTQKALQKYNDWYFPDFINHYHEKYGYQPIQIEFAIFNKIEEGYIQLTSDNKLIIT